MRKQVGFKRDRNVEPDVKKRSSRPAVVKAEKKMTSGIVKNNSGQYNAKNTVSPGTTLSKLSGDAAAFGAIIRPNAKKAVKKRLAQSRSAQSKKK
jgi:hypothetical protein